MSLYTFYVVEVVGGCAHRGGGAHPSIQTKVRTFAPPLGWPGSQIDHLLTVVVEVKNLGALPPLPNIYLLKRLDLLSTGIRICFI
jgi:hypothetical protein